MGPSQASTPVLPTERGVTLEMADAVDMSSFSAGFVRHVRKQIFDDMVAKHQFLDVHRSLMFGKGQRAREADQRLAKNEKSLRLRARREALLDRVLGYETVNEKISTHAVVPAGVNNRFAEERRAGRGDTLLTDPEKQRFVQASTKGVAGPLASWKPRADVMRGQFPVFCRGIKSSRHRDAKLMAVTSRGGLASSPVRLALHPGPNIEKTISPELAEAVVHAMRNDANVCSKGRACFIRGIAHHREERHLHLESEAAVMHSDCTNARRLGHPSPDGFLPSLVVSPLRRPVGKRHTHWRKLITKGQSGAMQYEGYVLEGTLVPHGRGKMEWADGASYDGDWSQGVMHGEFGVFTFANGSVYRGNWSQGNRSGRARYTSSEDGSCYEGGFLNGKRHGEGKQSLANGRILYSGSWIKDQRHGSGRTFWANGLVLYDGEWRHGIQWGRGKMFRRGGSLAYEGEWAHNHYQGEGKLHYRPHPRIKHEGWCRGTWNEGFAHGPDCHVMFDGLSIGYFGNIDRGNIAGSGRMEYPDHRVVIGEFQRVRLPLLRVIHEDQEELAAELEHLRRETAYCHKHYRDPSMLAALPQNEPVPPPLETDSRDIRTVYAEGTIIFSDDSRYDGHIVDGKARGKHGLKVTAAGTATLAEFDGGLTKNKTRADGIAWRLLVSHTRGYRGGARLQDSYPAMSATAALWLWFCGQEKGAFGGDKLMHLGAPTARHHQLTLVLRSATLRPEQCGSVMLRRNSQKRDDVTLLRGQPGGVRRAMVGAFVRARGDTTWPKSVGDLYKLFLGEMQRRGL